jgi:hypothetical protein
VRACIVSASGQNVFFEEILAALEDALTSHGVRVDRSIDHFPRFEDGVAYLFVPHEYLPLTQPEAHPSPAHLRRSVALCTEQPGTSWFEEGAQVAQQAGRVLDINSEGTAELRRRGIAAATLQLGYVPGWDHWRGDESKARTYDVTFMGGYTPRRAAALAACGRVLVGRRTDLRLVDSSTPHTAESASFLSGARKWEHLAASKAIINIHRTPLAYMEWHRVVGAIENGCVVVTERSLGTTGLVAGEHYVSTSLDCLPATLRALLDDPPRMSAIRHAAYTTIRDELPLDASVPLLADALDDVSRASVRGRPRGRICPVASPRRLQPPPPEYERIASQRTEMDVARMALKDIILRQRVLERRLEASSGCVTDRIETYGPAHVHPAVSVILTVHNYADVVGGAIRSVALSSHDDLELVVIDDASTDDSLDVVRSELADHGWLSATILAWGRNRGLPAARNAGVERARGRYVFILDADNEVYPHAFERLHNALEEDGDVVFAYGLLEAFDALGSRDLKSWLAWDPLQLRYGNFVDAMAMIRRSAVLAAGGYTLDPRLYGWEDFALWCEFAQRGWRGRLVPEIVARYRSSIHSMISIADIEASSAWSALVERYPFLSGEVASTPAEAW